MLKGILCGEHGKIPTEKCRGCKAPCLPYPVIYAMSQQRPIDVDNLSITQLLTPAWQLYLIKETDYYETKEELFFKLYGSLQHSFLEKAKTDGVLSPEDCVEQEVCYSIEGYTIRGHIDYYQAEANILWDYKTYGVFKAEKIREDILANGQELIVQTNFYSTCLNKQCGIKTLIICRDWRKYEYEGQLRTNEKASQGLLRRDGKQYKVKEPINCLEVITIPELSKQELRKVLADRIAMVKDTFATGKGICSEAERWDDKRCSDYCPVNFACPYWQSKEKT